MTNDLTRVLIVEDDPDTCANLNDILKLDGYQVDTVDSGNAATRQLKRNHYAIVLTDWHLPDGEVDVFLPNWQSLSPHSSFVIVSGNSELDDAIVALQDGVADYMTKPINGKLLRTRIGNLLKNRAIEKRATDALRLAAIGEMMAGIAHESRNGLQRIHAGIDTLKMDFRDLPQTEITTESFNTIARIEQATDGIERLLNEIREFAAPIHLETEPINLQQVWRSAWHNLSSVSNTDVIHFKESNSTDLGKSGLRVDADAFRMEQVFRNLFENSIAACQHSPRIQIDSRCVANGNGNGFNIEVVVRDNGKGIPASERDQVFAPFFTTKPKGTGLGMPIAKRIVEAHRGSIQIGYNQQPGTEIVLTLPLSPDDSLNINTEVLQQTSFSQLNSNLNSDTNQYLATVMQ